MASKKTTTPRKAVTSKSQVSIKNSTKFSWKTALLICLPIALVGAYLLQKSNAAASFTHTPSQVTGGTLVSKAGGSSYRTIKLYEQVDDTITQAEYQDSRDVCVHYLGGNNNMQLTLHSSDGTVAVSNVVRVENKSGDFCLGANKFATFKTKTTGTFPLRFSVHPNDLRLSSIQVGDIYGSPALHTHQ